MTPTRTIPPKFGELTPKTGVNSPNFGWVRLAGLGLVAVGAGAVGFAYERVFGDVSWRLVVPAALGGVGVSAYVTGVRRWSVSAAFLVSTAVGLVVAGAVTSAGAVADITDAPRRILDAPVPVADRPELLAIVAVTTWLVAAAGAEVSLRVGNPGAPVPVLVAGAAVPLVLGDGGGAVAAPLLAVVAVVGGLLVLVRSGGGASVVTVAARRLRVRRMAAAVPLVLVAGLLPAAVGDGLPWAAEADQAGRETPLGTRTDLRNPLVEVTAQRTRPQPREVFVADTSADVELWRTAVLDRYDGTSWSWSGDFAPAGGQLPAGPTNQSGGAIQTVEQAITVGSVDSPLLPAAGRPVRTDGARLRFDPVGGTLMADEPVADLRYTVESLVTQPTEAQLDVAQRDRRGADARTTSEPIEDAGLLVEIAIEQATTRSAGVRGSADVRQLRALQAFLGDQRQFRLTPDAVGGLTLRHLSVFVGQGGEGTVEQFATAFAVMARTLGYPTRVVVGYRTTGRDPDGRYHVTEHDAFAWTEVKLEGLGWVPFVALPLRSDDTPIPTAPVAPTTTTTAPDDDSAAPTDRPDRRPPVRPATDDGGGGLPLLLLVPLVLLLGAVVVAASSPAARWWRRRRRVRQAGVGARIDGAWAEVLDGFGLLGVPVTTAMTATEVVAQTTAHLGSPPPDARQLGRIVNTARFAPGHPSAGTAADAWRHARAWLAWGWARLPWKRRVLVAVDPRRGWRRMGRGPQ